jgi:hypothetical protein
MAFVVDEMVFLVAMSKLDINHTGTQARLKRLNVVQNAVCAKFIQSCTIGYHNSTYSHAGF